MEDLIFYRTWEEIQYMQQGTFKARPIVSNTDYSSIPPNTIDIQTLIDLGFTEIKLRQYAGTLERLRNIGVVCEDTAKIFLEGLNHE